MHCLAVSAYQDATAKRKQGDGSIGMTSQIRKQLVVTLTYVFHLDESLTSLVIEPTELQYRDVILLSEFFCSFRVLAIAKMTQKWQIVSMKTISELKNCCLGP